MLVQGHVDFDSQNTTYKVFNIYSILVKMSSFLQQQKGPIEDGPLSCDYG